MKKNSFHEFEENSEGIHENVRWYSVRNLELNLKKLCVVYENILNKISRQCLENSEKLWIQFEWYFEKIL